MPRVIEGGAVSPGYEEQAAPAPLSPWVAALWQFRGAPAAGAPVSHRILPDGCVDLLFSRDAGAVLIGPMTRARVAPIGGAADLFGIRLRPGALRSVAACDAREVRDAAVPLEVLGMASAFREAELFALPTLASRVHFIAPLLTAHVGRRPAPDAVVRAVVHEWIRALAADRPLPSITVTARRAGVTERGLERRFATEAGYTPAHFRRLVRFRRALVVSQDGRRPWADTALLCGYADQAHLSRDFHEFAAITATAWAAERPVGFIQDTPFAAL